MVNKKGWIRVVEASIAIIIIFGVLLAFQAQKEKAREKDYVPYLNSILEEIAKNSTLRQEVVEKDGNQSTIIYAFLEKTIKVEGYGHDYRICPYDAACGLEVYPETDQLYSSERIVSSSIDEFNPKRIKLFLWKINV